MQQRLRSQVKLLILLRHLFQLLLEFRSHYDSSSRIVPTPLTAASARLVRQPHRAEISIPRSIALHMSYTASSPADTAHMASISTPVRDSVVTTTLRRIPGSSGFGSISTSIPSSARGWHSGIKSAVRLAPPIDGQPGHRKDVSLLHFVGEDRVQRRPLHADLALCHGTPSRHRFRADVHHAGAALLIQVCERFRFHHNPY